MSIFRKSTSTTVKVARPHEGSASKAVIEAENTATMAAISASSAAELAAEAAVKFADAVHAAVSNPTEQNLEAMEAAMVDAEWWMSESTMNSAAWVKARADVITAAATPAAEGED